MHCVRTMQGFFQDDLRAGLDNKKKAATRRRLAFLYGERGALHANLQYVSPKHSREFRQGSPAVASSYRSSTPSATWPPRVTATQASRARRVPHASSNQ